MPTTLKRIIGLIAYAAFFTGPTWVMGGAGIISSTKRKRGRLAYVPSLLSTPESWKREGSSLGFIAASAAEKAGLVRVPLVAVQKATRPV